VKGGVVLSSEEAMSAADLGLLVRSGFSEPALLDEIRRRGIARALQPAEAEQLRASGASEAVMAAAADWGVILTPAEDQRYLGRVNQSGADRARSALAVERQLSAKEAERARQQELQDRITARAAEDRARAEAARQQYESQRKSLDSQIELERRYLRDLFQSGYRDTDFSVRRVKDRIKDLEKQRSELKSPALLPP
jgi:hypothetical protein